MTPPNVGAGVEASGRSIVAWLTVLQVLAALSAISAVALVFVPGGAEQDFANAGFGAPRWIIPLLSLAQALATFFVLGWAKGWLTNVRRWATGGGAPNADELGREDATLGRWLTFGQWLPILATALLGPLAWAALRDNLSAVNLGSSLPPGTDLSPETLRGAALLGLGIALALFVLPSVVINWAVLGWVRRWMRGVTDAALSHLGAARPPRETRLGEVAATLGRWFTFFQVLLIVLIVLLLAVPLVPGGTAGIGRLTLLLAFLQLALWLALLAWSKTFMFGVTRRAVG